MFMVTAPIIWIFNILSFLLGCAVGCLVFMYMIGKIEVGNNLRRVIAVKLGHLSVKLEGHNYIKWCYLLLFILLPLSFSVSSWLTAIISWPFVSYFIALEKNSGFVLLFCFLFMLLMLTITYVFVRLDKKRKTQCLAVDISNIYSYVTILRCTSIETKENLSKKFIIRFRNARNSDGVYPCYYNSSIACIETNYEIISALDNINIELIDPKQMILWIMKCHCTDGGDMASGQEGVRGFVLHIGLWLF